MKPLKIAATRSTPLVDFDASTAVLRIEGESYPEDAAKFYLPLLDWLKGFLDGADTPITVELKLSYLNTSSSKCVMTLLDSLEEAYDGGMKITVNWRVEAGNEIAYECGQEFSEDLSLPVNIVEEGG